MRPGVFLDRDGTINEQMGYITDVHARMQELLAQEGAHINGIYVCPHRPDAELSAYRMDCECRKPKTGLFTKAAADLNIDLARSYVVGDRWSDVRAALNCGATSILVLTGYGRGELAYIGPKQEVQPHWMAEDLVSAARKIVADLKLS
jgi:D-glycero-D-manno-heptose 1,7-bisphosphate phosphatase